MNIDFKIPSSPAAARKIMYAGKIMKLEIDPSVFSQAQEGLLTEEQVRGNLPGDLANLLKEKSLGLCQHAVDHGHRFVMGSKTRAQSQAFSLLAALATGEKVIIFGSNVKSISDAWQSTLALYNVPYVHHYRKGEAVDVDARVILAEAFAVDHTLLNVTRDRVAVCNVDIGQQTDRSVIVTLKEIFETNEPVGRDIIREFPKCINSFNLEQNDRLLPEIVWYTNHRVTELLTKFYPGLNPTKVFTQHSHAQNELLNMGFILRAPEHIAKLVGINLDYLS